MSRYHHAVAWLALAIACACSSGSGPADTEWSISDPEVPVPPLPPSKPASYHYVGTGGGTYTGVGELELDERRCHGYAFQETCLEFRLDGVEAPAGDIATGAMIELFIDPEDPLQPAWLDVQHAVIGPVEAVDAAHAQMTVLGQTIYITDRTEESGEIARLGVTDLDELRIGDWVGVSGRFSAGGEIVASLIQHRELPSPRLLRGALAIGREGTFRIGEMDIDLSDAMLEGFPGGTPLAGDVVVVLAEDAPREGALTAESMRYASREARSFANELLIGFVTDVRSSHDFDVGGHGFRPSACVACDVLAARGRPLTIGTFVYAGTSPTNGSHLSLGWTTGDDTGVGGPVEAIDAEAGAVSVLGFNVQTTPATRITIDSGASIGTATLDFTELAIGDVIAVNGGRWDRGIVADRLARVGNDAWIRARDYELDDPAIVILGRNIEVDLTTTVQACSYFADNCAVMDPAWLFRQASMPPAFLLIYLDVAGTRLRALRVIAYSQEL